MKIAAIVVLLLCAWIAWDIGDPRTHDLRDFNGHEVASLETATWRSYYDHQPVRLFGELTELLRRQYGFPFWRSVAGAYHAARAAEVFQAGHQREDYMRALPDLVRYYRLIRRTGTEQFDVNKVAALELEWWIIHRERARYGRQELDRSLAELQGAIYQQPSARFAEHAHARAEAMLLRDQRAAEAGSPSPQDWNKIRGLLDISWVSLRDSLGTTER